MMGLDIAVGGIDFAALEVKEITLVSAHYAIGRIAKLAGCKGGRVTVYFSTYEDYPPTLQRVGARGKIMKKRRNEKARGNRRVVVGRRWLQQHAPELWAAFVAAKLIEGSSATIPSTIPTRNK